VSARRLLDSGEEYWKTFRRHVNGEGPDVAEIKTWEQGERRAGRFEQRRQYNDDYQLAMKMQLEWQLAADQDAMQDNDHPHDHQRVYDAAPVEPAEPQPASQRPRERGAVAC
jgi:hypothetical protein